MTHTILIVENDPSVSELWVRTLAGAGYVVRLAADAVEGARLLADWQPSVAICDAHLPGTSSVWLADLIQHHFPTTALVLATADHEIPPHEALRPAIVAYLLKPVGRDELLAAVETAVAWSVRARERQ
jgi:CheY-like chemotaxis protein